MSLSRPLMDIAAWTMVFLESASDDQVDPDVAVERLEEIAASLGELTAEERAEFTAHVRTLAATERRPEIRQLLRKIPYAIGWEDEVAEE